MSSSSGPHIPPGYHEPVCRPMTHRIMMAGVPFEALMILVFAGMQLINFGAFELLVALPVAWWGMRALYRRDEWGVGAWLDHVRAVTQKTTRLEV